MTNWEDVSIQDCFDDTCYDIKDMERKVNEGLLVRHGATPARQPRRKTDFEPMKRQPMQYRGSDQPRIPACPLPAQGDARRYRWLRRNCDALWKKYAPNPECTLDQFDAAIDAEVRK